MGCRSLLTSTALVASLGLVPLPAMAQNAAAEGRVLADAVTGFNPAAVRGIISTGDAAASRGNLTAARASYDQARKAAKQLLAFYRDLGGSFRGLDARIPREMDSKGRDALELLAEADLRPVRFADDFLILCRTEREAEDALALSDELLARISHQDFECRCG